MRIDDAVQRQEEGQAEMSGKGDTYRPVDPAKYEANYERIFGKKKRKARK